MDARQISADLLRLGFTVEKKNGLWFVGFPDGQDGCVFDADQMAVLNVAQLADLANLRREAVDGIRALLAHGGWGMQFDGCGDVQLGCGSVSSRVDVGLPLTFWLRRAGLRPTLRRFVEGYVRDLDEHTLDRVRRIDAATKSRMLYDEHVATCAEIDANAIELETDPEETAKLMAEVEAYQREAEREHRAWVDARRVDGSVDAQLHDVLVRARSNIRGGNGLWIGCSPLWASDIDDWATPDEWIEWATPLLDRWVGHAGVLLRFAPERFAPIVREKLLDAMREHTLEHDESDLELAVHCVDDESIADWVFSPQPLRNLRSAVAAAGLRDGLYGPARQVSMLLQQTPTDLLHWLSDVNDAQSRIGWLFFSSILTAEQRAQIAATCHAALDVPTEPMRAAVTAETVLMVALGLGDAEIAQRIATEPFWQSATLWRWNGRQFLGLKNGILAMSLLMPDENCGRLIERATEHLDHAYDSHGVDSTAFALAVAWRRCTRAVTSTTI